MGGRISSQRVHRYLYVRLLVVILSSLSHHFLVNLPALAISHSTKLDTLTIVPRPTSYLVLAPPPSHTFDTTADGGVGALFNPQQILQLNSQPQHSEGDERES